MAFDKRNPITGQLQRTHGMSRTPTYGIWTKMLDRCRNQNNPSFRWYGARGIRVSDRWLSFENFLADMGERPSPRHSLDRYPDQSGSYEPSNCRWATNKEQHNNKRSNRRVTFDGLDLTLAQWGEKLGIDPNTLYGRYRKGWMPPELFMTSVQSLATSRSWVRRAALVAHNGSAKPLGSWARELGINKNTLYLRFARGERPPKLFRPTK